MLNICLTTEKLSKARYKTLLSTLKLFVNLELRDEKIDCCCLAVAKKEKRKHNFYLQQQ